MNMKIDYFKLIASIAVTQLTGIVSGLFTSKSIPNWYDGIKKPSFTPPGGVIGTVWTLLYLMMGISLYLVWNTNGEKKTALILFGVQLALNFFWSIIFFGLKQPGYAFIEMILLWIMILATIISFYSINKTASYMLIPYLLWVSFAAILNYNIWKLN